MAGPVTLLGICGSLRNASLNRALLRELGAVLPSHATLSIDETLGELPLFNSDIATDPSHVVALKTAIANADGVVFACPEYNYSVTSALKNALDWVSRPPTTAPLRRKPCGIIGGASGMSGTIRAQNHLRSMLLFSDVPVLNQPEVLIPRHHERFDAEGKLTDESTKQLLAKFGAAFVSFVELNRAR